MLYSFGHPIWSMITLNITIMTLNITIITLTVTITMAVTIIIINDNTQPNTGQYYKYIPN